MFCRNIQKDRKPFIRPYLIFRRYIQGDIVPPIEPVPGQSLLNATGTLCQQPKMNIRTSADHIPDFIPPDIRFFQKEIAGHADPQEQSHNTNRCFPVKVHLLLE